MCLFRRVLFGECWCSEFRRWPPVLRALRKKKGVFPPFPWSRVPAISEAGALFCPWRGSVPANDDDDDEDVVGMVSLL